MTLRLLALFPLLLLLSVEFNSVPATLFDSSPHRSVVMVDVLGFRLFATLPCRILQDRLC